MIGTVSAQIALLGFAVGIVGGLYAGNPAATILGRALTVMLVALFVSQAIAYASKLVLRDHFMRRKLDLDVGHLRASRPGEGQDEASASADAPGGSVRS
jgi:hypothetical protein